MKNTYLTLLILVFTLCFVKTGEAQNASFQTQTEQNIEGLNIYPNPVNSNSQSFVTIQSKFNSEKTIEFYDVLGKRIFSTKLRSKELDISQLNKGVYILKITEKNISEARKLVIK